MTTTPTTAHLVADRAQFAAAFPRRPFTVGHTLADHPLFRLERLVELSKRLPAGQVEYNAGDVDIDMADRETPQTGLSVEETIRRIETCRSWMVLKHVEADPAYADLLNACLDQVQPFTDAVEPGMVSRHAFIFISSPGSRTPYHNDPEHNFLLQVRGHKDIHIWPGDDRTILTDEEIENRVSGAPRTLVYRDAQEGKASVFRLDPGRGLFFPYGAPHWVQNGDAVSVSFSITFTTHATHRMESVYQGNAMLRRWGIAPRTFGAAPWRDSAVCFLARGVRKVGRLVGR
jgi:hypothetical protein